MQMEKDVKILNLDDILPNRFQPRITFNEKAILELADSIKEHGVIQPIIVRKIADKYEIIAGERRYKASVLAGKTTIPAIIVDLNDKDSAEIALIENVQRQNLTPIEEAVSYKKILDMGYLNQSDLANKLGKNQSTIANKLRLLNLSDEVQDALLKEKISERHARSLLKLDKEKQNMMLNRIVTERLTVRKTDEEIQKLLNSNPISAEESSPLKKLNPIKKEGNEKMNQNEINNFNIPSEPIQENNINPGFMDVNKIESQAMDINSIPTTPVSEPVQEQPQASIFSGPIPQSTFTQPVSNPEPIQTQASSVTFDQPQEPINPFYQFQEPVNQVGQTTSNVIPPVVPTIPELPKQEFNPMPDEIVSGGKFFNIPNNDVPMTNQINSDYNQNQAQPNIAPIVPPVATEDTVHSEPVNPVASLFAATQNRQPLETIPSYQEQNQFEPNIPMMDQPLGVNQEIPNFVPSMPTEPIVNVMPQPTNDFNQIPNVPIESVDNGANPTMNQYPYQQVTNEPTINSNQSLVEIGGNGMITEEPVLQPVMQVDKQPKKADLKEAILLIRNCADKIERMGFTIDVEELDFENSYQVSFRIDKQ